MSELKKIVVIGSNSFSGSDFIDHLLAENRFDVIGISRSPEKSDLFLPYRARENANFKFHQLDLNKNTNEIVDLLDDAQPDCVVNFAAQSEVAPSWEHPDHWFETNVVALSRLLNRIKGRPYLKRYLHVSSPEVYGTCVGRVLESAPLNPSTPYAASKAAADMFLSTLVKNFKFPLLTVRSTNVYGAHQQLFKIIPRTAIYLKLGKKVELHGGGVAVKSYIHIHDISRGELAILEKGEPGKIYHLSPNQGIAVKDIVRLICEKMGKKYEDAVESVQERLGQDAAYVIDSARARAELGWSPVVDVNAGLNEVVSWVNANWEKIQRETINYLHKE